MRLPRMRFTVRRLMIGVAVLESCRGHVTSLLGMSIRSWMVVIASRRFARFGS